MAWCLPRWHETVAAWVADPQLKTRIRSGCTSDAQKVVRCPPESMRRQAEGVLRGTGLWVGGDTLPMDTYALARNLASENPSGTPETLVAVAECAINEARRQRKTVAQMLTFSNVANGTFGGIPGRWASTRQDPRYLDIVIADFVLRGKTGNFARGGTSYVDPLAFEGKLSHAVRWLRGRLASNRWLWVGELPNVPLTKLFVMRQGKPSPQMAQQFSAAIERVGRGQTAEPPTEVCPSGLWGALPVVGVTVFGTGLAAIAAYAIAEGTERRYKPWRKQ